MRTVTVEFEGITNYGQGLAFQSEKKPKEAHDKYEERCWRERMHVNEDGIVTIPRQAFKLAMFEAAKFNPQKGPTGGTSTWTKHFRSGLTIVDDVVLPIKASDVKPKKVFVPSDGRAGSGKRVWKHFPEIPRRSFRGIVVFHVLDDHITEEVFADYFREAGVFIGIGVWRPANNGEWGRFQAKKITWKTLA